MRVCVHAFDRLPYLHLSVYVCVCRRAFVPQSMSLMDAIRAKQMIKKPVEPVEEGDDDDDWNT